jgi:tetratricopeptide (TPR) repeat protein
MPYYLFSLRANAGGWGRCGCASRPPSINVAAAPKADDFYIRGNQKYQDKDFKGAIADYTEAIRLNPNLAEAFSSCIIYSRTARTSFQQSKTGT